MAFSALQHQNLAGAAPRATGFSLLELVTTISIIGVLAGIVALMMGDGLLASKESLAHHRVEMLNRGLYQFAQQNYELVFNARSDSASDEMFVLRTIQYRNPDEDRAKAGSPYVTPYYNPATSSSTDDFRIRWTGKLYELLRPGQSGSGIKLVFDGSDMTEAFQFPPNFQMAGR